jgi:CDP-ribitol ribitolphosphotransferase
MTVIAIKIINLILELIYLPIKLFPVRKKITVISRQSNEESVDIRMIREAVERDIPDCEVVVLMKMVPDDMLGKIGYAFHMITQMYHIATSRVVLLDTYCIVVSMLHHKKNLTVIQMWHALGLMKKAGYSILDKPEGRSYSLATAMKLHRNYKIVFASSEECRKAIGEVFGYSIENVQNYPLPRVDLLRNNGYIENTKNKITNQFPQLKEKENVLYAPTFRKDESEMKGQIERLLAIFPYDKYNLIMNLHPLSGIRITDARIVTNTSFSTMEMLAVADYMISDYSSIIYEAGIMEKKLLFYAFDLDSYKSRRDFFIDYQAEVPGPVCRNADEVVAALGGYPFEKEKIRMFAEKYVDISIANCTERIVQLLIEELADFNRI